MIGSMADTDVTHNTGVAPRPTLMLLPSAVPDLVGRVDRPFLSAPGRNRGSATAAHIPTTTASTARVVDKRDPDAPSHAMGFGAPSRPR